VQVAQPLGRAGDGLVYLALDGVRQARLREYAPARVVRRLPDGTLHPADPRLALAWLDGAARFLDQGHRLASIDHLGIAPIWRAASVDADGVRQGAYLIGAPVGEPLAAALAGGLELAPPAILKLAAELGEALAEVHARGLAHLDIAPDTVSLASGRLELTDFAVDNRPFMPLLESQYGLVRPGYSPIEHHDASMAEPLGAPADVYAACALLFRLITGRDPAPWQERWRDPAASHLPEVEDYPRDFLAAIRTGMAIEPQDRFRDGTQLMTAMALPPPEVRAQAPPAMPLPRAAPLTEVPPAPAAFDKVTVEPAPRRRRSLLPLLLLLAVVAIGIGGFLAYTQRWFVPADDGAQPGNAVSARLPASERPRPADEATPTIQPGSAVSGQLGPGDARRGGGQYEDRFILNGRAGERLEIRLSAAQFDPLIGVYGPGFQAANDDDGARGTRDARLLITLPRAGRYTLSVSSYARGGAGNYLLEVQTARPAISIATPAMLAGRWRRSDDATCASPALISVEGDELVIDYGGAQARERILDGIGRVIRTRRAGAAGGTERGYRLSDEGDRFELDNGNWVRC
jgi:hypothetical protein